MGIIKNADEIVKLFTNEKGFPTDGDLTNQLDTFAVLVGSRAVEGPHSKWNRMINDDGKIANVIFTYNISGDEARNEFGIIHYFDSENGSVGLGPINLDPITFNDEILKRIAKMYNRGDGSKAKDVQLSIEDSNVTNPFDSSDFNVQAQLAFRVTLKDSDTDEANE